MKCYFCDKAATTRTRLGIPICKRCLDAYTFDYDVDDTPVMPFMPYGTD